MLSAILHALLSTTSRGLREGYPVTPIREVELILDLTVLFGFTVVAMTLATVLFRRTL